MYKIEAVFDGENVGNGVLAPITIVNGLSTPEKKLTQFYCTVTVFTKKLEAVFTAAGKDIRFYGLGSPLQIEMTETSGSTASVIFDGVITDTRSSQDTLTFTAVDKDIITLSRNRATWTGSSSPNRLCEYVELLATNAGITGWFDEPNPTLQPFLMDPVITPPEPLQTESTSYVIEALAQDAYSGCVRINVPTVKTDASEGVGKIYLMTASNPLIGTVMDLTDNDIDQNYDLRRGASEIANKTTILKTGSNLGGDSVANNFTSQAAIGVVNYEASSFLYTQAERDLRADLELSKRNDVGWPVVTYRTSYDRIADQFTDEIDCYESLVTANRIDVSAITEPFIQNAAVILQVRHELYEKYWSMEIDTIDASALAGGIRWFRVDSATTWAGLPAELTWDMLKSIDI